MEGEEATRFLRSRDGDFARYKPLSVYAVAHHSLTEGLTEAVAESPHGNESHIGRNFVQCAQG